MTQEQLVSLKRLKNSAKSAARRRSKKARQATEEALEAEGDVTPHSDSDVTPHGDGDGDATKASDSDDDDVDEITSDLPVRRRSSSPSETRLRFWIAGLLRVSDNLVSKAVASYNRLFELPAEEQAEIYLQMGREMAHSGNIQDALEALRSASKLMPEDSSALVEIGLIQLRRRAPEAAIQAFQKAKDRGSSTYRLHTSFAKALMMRERYAEAIDELKVAVMHKPDSAEAYFRLGTALDHDKRYEEAIEAFGTAIELAPQEVEYLQALGFALESAGRRKEAIKCFKRALDLEHRSEVA